MAFVIYTPQWVLSELSKAVFSFFWNGKPDLVTRDVVAQPPSSGGFPVINIQLKVWALLVQWVKHFSLSGLHGFPFFRSGVAKALLLLLFRFYPAHLVSLVRVGCRFSIFLSSLLGGLLVVLSCLVRVHFVLVAV